ncbi:MAG: hypothetical protein AAB426_02675 [Myxococcota bacterium]
MAVWRENRSVAKLLVAASLLCGHGLVRAAEPCPPASRLPQLTLDDVVDSAVPIYDRWQVVWDDVPFSDVQVAQLAGDGLLVDELDSGMRNRGGWVYFGMVAGAVGTALSSTGWVLYGQNQLSQGITLPLAFGGLGIGVAGVLLVTETIQRAAEPYMAPTPRHRLSRAQARRLVAAVNERLFGDICKSWREASEASQPLGAKLRVQ